MYIKENVLVSFGHNQLSMLMASTKDIFEFGSAQVLKPLAFHFFYSDLESAYNTQQSAEIKKGSERGFTLRSAR